MPDVYMSLGDLNSGLQSCAASCVHTKIALQDPALLFWRNLPGFTLLAVFLAVRMKMRVFGK